MKNKKQNKILESSISLNNLFAVDNFFAIFGLKRVDKFKAKKKKTK